MSYVMQIPLMNDIRFVPEGQTLSNRYRQIQFDREWDHKSRLPFQNNTVYYQKKQKDDDNCIQVHTNCTDLELQIQDTQGNIITTLFPNDTIVLPGNEYNGISLQTYQWEFKMQDVASSFTGKCYYVLKGTDPLLLTELYWVSEPIWVKQKWKDSILINYTHNRNEYEVAFSMNPIFTIRVGGYLLYDDTENADTEFEDQYNSNKVLHSATTRKFKLTIGGYTGIPRYLHNKLTEAFRCQQIRVDGWAYSKDKGAKLEYEKSDTNTLFNCSMLLQEYSPVDSYTFSKQSAIQILPATGFPYAVVSVALIDFDTFNYTWLTTDANAFIMEDMTAATDYVNDLNTAATSLGLNGTFSISGGWIVYNMDADENFIPYTVAKYKYFSIEYTSTAPNADAWLAFKNNDIIVIDWAGDIELLNASSFVQNANTTFSNEGIGDILNVRVFHNDDIQHFETPFPFALAKISALGEVMSSILEVFSIDNLHSSAVNIDLSLLQYCFATLTTMRVKNSFIETINNHPFAANAANPINFRLLADIDFSFNSLTVAALEDFVLGLHDDANYAYQAIVLNKTIIMDNQTPPATPNAPTVAAIGDLVGAGWNAQFD